ncbi:MAG: ADP-ribose pyrophosphatase [Candidatus Nanosalina sp. J07AB43]|nr:MAG: ADP-ribose pyrophosphatase [Candidatus Nanosalina sp. J07AB43]
MNRILHKASAFVKNYPERILGRLFGRVFWPPVTVAVLAHGENDDIMALKLNGEYHIPGGFLKKDEDIRQAARREFKEETGFEIELNDLIDIGKNGSGGPEMFFEADIIEGVKDGSWEGEPEFVKKEDFQGLNWRLEHSHVHKYLFPQEAETRTK